MKVLWIWVFCVMLLFSGCTKPASGWESEPSTEVTSPSDPPTEPTATTAPEETMPPETTAPDPYALGGTPLTREELDWFQNEFFTYENTDENGNIAPFNIRNMFLRPHYETVRDIDLYKLFYDGISWDSHPTEEEIERYTAIAKEDLYWNAGEPFWDCFKIPEADMEQLFLEHTGVPVSETKKINLSKLTYLTASKAYYLSHSDTAYTFWTMQKGARMEDGTVVLLYTDKLSSIGNVCKVTLMPHGDSYIFVSNLPV